MKPIFSIAGVVIGGCCAWSLWAGALPSPAELDVLPLGSVRAEGWLLRQLEKQRDGLTGHAEELYDDIGASDWLTNVGRGGQYAWERGPYYAKGLVALALTLDDSALKQKARRWVDAALASQRPSGDFGPKADNWWANMIVLHYLRDWAEVTGDVRIEPFLRRYFAYQSKRLADCPLLADSAWAACRVGDELEVVLWLYDRTGSPELLNFAKLLTAQASDWTTYYREGGNGRWAEGYRMHIVNFMQGLKFPALRFRLFGEERDRLAYDAAFDAAGWAMQMHGRPDRMLNGTEPLSGRDTTEGTELCAIAERILSCRDVIAATGNLKAADDMEIVAYNALPAILGDDGRGVRYYLVLNQPNCRVEGRNGFECNEEGGAVTPGPDSGYGCCRSNYHFAWPKFTQSLWMRKGDGLAAIAYAPSLLKTDRATIRTEGAYPFGDSVALKILSADGSKWPLFVRVPGWSRGAAICVNGETVPAARAGEFVRIDRAWKAGDCIALTFPAAITTERGLNQCVSVRRGPIVYVAAPAAEIRELPTSSNRTGFPVREYLAKDDWNWMLLMADGGQSLDAASFKPATADSIKDPFRQEAAPCRLLVKASRTGFGGWGTYRPDRGGLFSLRILEPPPSPVPPEMQVSAVQNLELVPLGSTQIRITSFPWTVARPEVR